MNFYVCVCVCIDIYIYIHTHTHTYIHTYILLIIEHNRDVSLENHFPFLWNWTHLFILACGLLFQVLCVSLLKQVSYAYTVVLCIFKFCSIIDNDEKLKGEYITLRLHCWRIGSFECSLMTCFCLLFPVCKLRLHIYFIMIYLVVC